jgi:phenylacetaldehyde dehydrogenase
LPATALPEQLSSAARAFATREHLLLIDGALVAARDGATFETLDPATTEAITTVAQAGAEDVDRAVAAARRAFADGPGASLRRPGGRA